MEEKIYAVEQIAEMLQLHPKQLLLKQMQILVLLKTNYLNLKRKDSILKSSLFLLKHKLVVVEF